MIVIDSQVHLQVAGTPSPHHLQAQFLAGDLLREMQAAGVDRVVVVPPTWDPNVNAPALEAAHAHPDRFAVMGRIDIEKRENAALLAGWKAQPGMLGLRFVMGRQPREAWLPGGVSDWLWPAAERAGVPIMMHAAGKLDIMGEIAQRHPGLRLTVDHMGCTLGGKDEAAFAHLPQLLALAKYPNIAVKASGAPTYSSRPYPFEPVHEPLRRVFDAFGPRRMFWGTDLTRRTFQKGDSEFVGSYRECVTLFTEALPWLSAADKEQIMGRALCDWIGWRDAA